MSAEMLRAIEMLWQGMLGVFVVIGVIAFIVSMLSRFTRG